jgi:hypothetical protein
MQAHTRGTLNLSFATPVALVGLFAAACYVAPQQQQPAHQGGTAQTYSASGGTVVIVNGVQIEGAAIPPGDYWYDTVSGLWGYAGGPSQGVTQAGLQAPPLTADASGGGTNIFINGREIHPQEYYYLVSLYGTVQLGRYWLDATGNVGFEGGPAIANLRTAAQGQGGSSDGTFYNGTVSGGSWDGGGMVSVKNADGSFSSVGW